MYELRGGVMAFRMLTVLMTVILQPQSLGAGEQRQQAPPDVHKYAGLAPDKAAAAMTVPEGFTVTLFAGEPDVRQPIAFCLDDRGRLWVAEAYSYPIRRADKDAKDRIIIFEAATGGFPSPSEHPARTTSGGVAETGRGTGTFVKRTVG